LVLTTAAARSEQDRQSCDPIPGLDSLASAPIRFLVFGEMHGTEEVPAFVGDAACLLALKRPVIIAVELPTAEEANTKTFVQSKGAKNDIESFLRSPVWSGEYQWGATSAAMFRLIDRVREMQHEGSPISVAHFMPVNKDGEAQNVYEKRMADELKRIAARNAGTIVVVLTGNIHARKAPWAKNLKPAIAHLSTRDVLSFDMMASGGAAWNCQSDGCGPHKLGAVRPLKPRGLYHNFHVDPAFDGEFSVGKPLTASPPASTLHTK
jgi:hypothetical protein